MTQTASAGARFRAAVQEESPLQVMGAITAYAGLMAKRTGYKALYLSGGGVAANSLGVPDLGISTMEDVLTDARRIVDATGMPLLVDIDTGWGGAFNIGRTVKSFINVGVAAVHMEDQVGQKRCGHRPGKEVVSTAEMVDRVKAAVDARTDDSFVIMARTDAAAVEGLDAAIERAVAYVEAGADAIQIEDQTFPKRCGHFAGKDVAPLPEMVAKVKAAVDARTDPNLLIVARTDAAAVEGFEAAVHRALALAEAGADILFVEAVRGEDEVRRLPALLTRPALINIVIGGQTPVLPASELATCGYGCVLYANAALQGAVRGMQAALGVLRSTGRLDEDAALVIPFAERQRLVDKPFFDELEVRYA